MIWDQLTSPQISRIDKNIPVVLAMTATEQHGSHLPLATDRIIGEYFAQRLHQSRPKKVLILPTVSIGYSKHHMDFAGTLTLSHMSLIQQIIDIIDSVIKHGFKKIILLNSHGGNEAVGQVLIEKLGNQYPDAHFVLATWWKISASELVKITESDLGGIGHGGEFETSLMMLIAPQLVADNKIKSKQNIPTFSWAEGDMLRSSQASYYRPIKEMTGNGVFGEPTSASAEKGKKIANYVVTALESIVDDLFEIKNDTPNNA